jgi:hypothetical protein
MALSSVLISGVNISGGEHAATKVEMVFHIMICLLLSPERNRSIEACVIIGRFLLF